MRFDEGKVFELQAGGLKAKGHPIGATGVSMHAITAMQLTGQAGRMQLPKADLGGVFNMGGAAVANYVSILEPAGLIPTANLAHCCSRRARRFPDRPALDLARHHLDLGVFRHRGPGRRRRAG